MRTRFCFFLILMINISIHSLDAAKTEIEEMTYGSAEILRIHDVTSDFTLICDIRDFPPVIGQQIPIKIRGLEPLESASNSNIYAFLKTLFLQTPADPNQPVQLNNIQRGNTFCLISDIEVNGEDLGDLLVREGLVERVLKIPATSPQIQRITQATTPQLTATAGNMLRPVPPTEPKPKGAFVASKSSKIFHRVNCPHAKRITEAKKVYFSNRRQAIESGRRPCKMCNP